MLDDAQANTSSLHTSESILHCAWKWNWFRVCVCVSVCVTLVLLFINVYRCECVLRAMYCCSLPHCDRCLGVCMFVCLYVHCTLCTDSCSLLPFVLCCCCFRHFSLYQACSSISCLSYSVFRSFTRALSFLLYKLVHHITYVYLVSLGPFLYFIASSSSSIIIKLKLCVLACSVTLSSCRISFSYLVLFSRILTGFLPNNCNWLNVNHVYCTDEYTKSSKICIV